MTGMLMLCVQIVVATASGIQGAAGWTGQDIGTVGPRGSEQPGEDTMTWVVRGSGGDIFNVEDGFHFVHRRIQGDGSIIAKVESVGKTDPWAKGGVMIRESLEPISRFAGLYATPDSGVSLQARIQSAQMALSDTAVSPREQKALKAPIWIKLERKGNQFRGYYATDEKGTAWTPMTWKPQTIPMARTVYIGLAVTSHVTTVLCEAKFSGVTVSGADSGIPDAEVVANPKQALVKAYQELERFGNWGESAATVEEYGNLIAGSLFTIARARERRGEPASMVLPDYYRIARVLPNSAYAVDALAKIVVLDETKGLDYALKCIATKSKEDQDRFHAAMMKGCCSAPETPAREAAIRSFAEYVGKSSNLALLDEAVANLKGDEQATSVYKSLIQHCMAQPSGTQAAVVTLRYMALKPQEKQKGNRIEELAQWAADQFKDAKLTTCAKAILADIHYAQGHYFEVVEAFQPGLLSGNQAELKTVEGIENALAQYRANTLRQNGIDLEQIYQALGEKATGSKLNIVALHCQRKVAEIEGLSLERFERSAEKGVKYSESSPENEVWFWKGLIAAESGDLGRAAAAYERFVQGDGKSILAARAYYDIARAKMAMGEGAKEWVAKAKALSPCDAVMELERRLNTQPSARDQG
jgi:regulation of enolase protein 1 (concanavalin A-like superfamily)